MMTKLLCQVCHKPFLVYPSWAGRRVTCSRECANILLKEKKTFLGKKHTQEAKEKMARAKSGLTGNEANRWCGDRASYSAVHMWVRKMLGKPDACELCGRSGLSGRQVHWANKSGEYKRDLNDWIRVCTSCHRKLDKKRVTAKNHFVLGRGGYRERKVSYLEVQSC